ncbi:MAG: nucleoside phosphorylase [Bacteroidota bacterium]
MENRISEADLIINPDGSIYHLNLLPEDIAPTVITVGDPDRVGDVSKYFDSIDIKKGRREFITHTGYIGKMRVTVLSTGIGTDNIDIVLNELDALVNVDFKNRVVKNQLTSLNIIRVGTSGAIQEDVPTGSILASSYGLGLDALMRYYVQAPNNAEQSILQAFEAHSSNLQDINPYITAADEHLLNVIGKDMMMGITATAPGFYAPQGRKVRARNTVPDLINILNSFKYDEIRITNLEMETAGIYALAKTLGHKALSVNAILASRVGFQFSKDPAIIVDRAIQNVLGLLEYI